jgi:RNA polymerase sigma-70 factor (ECF subfamily)
VAPPADAEDLEAIRSVLTGQVDAFRLLVDKYKDSIVNLAYRFTGNRADAHDLAQDAFLQAYARLADFRVGSRFHPWLYTIALNICRNHVRRRKLLRWIPLEAPSRDRAPDRDPPERAADPEAALLDREADMRLQRAIDSLPLKYREVFLLRQAQELSYEEIAEVTGLPIGTVEVRLFRARKRLVAALALPAAGGRTAK